MKVWVFWRKSSEKSNYHKAQNESLKAPYSFSVTHIISSLEILDSGSMDIFLSKISCAVRSLRRWCCSMFVVAHPLLFLSPHSSQAAFESSSHYLLNRLIQLHSRPVSPFQRHL